MREQAFSTLLLLWLAPLPPQPVPDGWKLIKDARNACQIAVPPEWTPFAESPGAAVFQDSTTAMAVVTTQPAQAFAPLTPSLQKIVVLRKDALFENTARRIFYQDKFSHNAEDPNAYSASVPGKTGTCSCRVLFLPSIPKDTARRIALSLGPVPD